tara:strand:+ start:2362 stop:2754 length:393 start_codon:yes stop_codon:yes gene_type:complete
MKIEVSNGEIIDKYTILEIKLVEIKDSDKLVNVQAEYDSLTPVVDQIYNETHAQETLAELKLDLLNINKTLWNIEDIIRDHEREERFDSDFIELARSVYYTNDERAEVKKQINQLTGSVLVEEKSYQEYK